MSTAETIGGRIRHIRGELSQEDFATQIGVHKNAVGKYERDENIPGGDVLKRLYKVKAVNITWLLTGSGHPYAVKDLHAPSVDPQLLGRVYDKVFRTFKDANVPISPLAMGTLVAEIYNELSLNNDDPEDRLIALGERIVQLHNDLRSPVDSEGTSKQAG